jgi:L-fuconolactonase
VIPITIFGIFARRAFQRYLLHELADDRRSGHNVRSSVFSEARAMYRADGPEEMRPIGEVEFVQRLAAASASGLYGPGRAAAAIVGRANLLLATASPRCSRHCRRPVPTGSGASAIW